MALNQIERRILIAARQYLVDKREERICHALNEASNMVIASAPQSRKAAISDACAGLRIFIMRAIKRADGKSRFGFEDWVREDGGAQSHLYGNADYMRASRIAWIDWLLDEPWTEWNGGGCPLLPDETVHVRCRDGYKRTGKADTFRWNHINPFKPEPFDKSAYARDIVSYKVIYEAPNASN